MNNISTKEFVRNYGILVLLTISIIVVLIPLTFAANKSWEKGLKTSVDRVINEENNSWVIGDNIEITSPMTTNAAAYKINNIENGEEAEAVILRMNSLYGPQAVVFIYHIETETVDFAGYSSIHGRIENQLKNKPYDKRLEYWQNAVPAILGR